MRDIFVRFYKCLVMDIILSTAFGVKSNCQTNPDDPLMAKGKAAMKQTPLKQAISGILLLLPFGNKVMQLLSKWLFSAFFDLSDVAKGVIDFRKTDPSTKRMVCCLNKTAAVLYLQLLLLCLDRVRRHYSSKCIHRTIVNFPVKPQP